MIDKSTLMALLLYLDIHKEEPEFFGYIKRQLFSSNIKANNSQQLSEEQFLQMLVNPSVDFKTMQPEEMASVFKIFDRKLKGSFSYSDFMEIYKDSREYNSLDQSHKAEFEKKLQEQFKTISKSQDGEITPIEFYNIIQQCNPM
eukprot:TRINITY_DN6022_c0_g1_i3.p1 TRINITY_DN6022_c0_g1~~TRINITY_DN6022_c0_g1_i3.p1  ORF type:complete len:144 (+),score=33.82 TRINITY_DN6022_c0_g1_i3:171-602(+)